MGKNKTMKMISITLLIVMIALILVSGTYAKYTSSATGSDSARVAKWAFNVGGTDIASNTFKFDLFKTIKDSDGNEENDVVSANGDKVIAPGTSGSFDISLENKSEVSAKYGIKFTVTNTKSIPIQFSTDGNTWTDSLTNIAADDTKTRLAPNGTKTITVQWKWAYEDTNEDTKETTDAKDLALGTAGTATITVSAEVTATQAD